MKQVEVAAGIIEYNGKILCAQREKGKHSYLDYKWEFPGGKLEAGETQQQALARELNEELEMEVDIQKFFGDVVYTYPDFTLTMHLYLCKAHSDKINMNVHHDIKWLDKSQLCTLDWAAADVEAVKAYAASNNKSCGLQK